MKILVSYRGITDRPGWATGDYLCAALTELGHEAIPYGNIYQTNKPIAQYAPWTGVPGGVYLHIWLECNDQDPQYTELLARDVRRVLWDFDTEMHPNMTRHIAQHCQRVYVANGHYATDGWTYLPYAVDPQRFMPRGQRAGAAIIGTPFKERVAFARAAGVDVVTGVYGDAYAEAVAALAVHVHHLDSGGQGLLVCRVWETLASGTVLVTADTPEIRKHFDDGVHLRLYRDAHGCRRIVDELLRDAEQRARLGSNGREIVLRQHTWLHRARQIVEDAR